MALTAQGEVHTRGTMPLAGLQNGQASSVQKGKFLSIDLTPQREQNTTRVSHLFLIDPGWRHTMRLLASQERDSHVNIIVSKQFPCVRLWHRTRLGQRLGG